MTAPYRALHLVRLAVSANALKPNVALDAREMISVVRAQCHGAVRGANAVEQRHVKGDSVWQDGRQRRSKGHRMSRRERTGEQREYAGHFVSTSTDGSCSVVKTNNYQYR